ncbi:LysM receptor kinase [Melia azedarach]|uniref:LysM receptor kinase n=1 Tax=Melia azedarach TaxID=155640 RepID=A0ACC1XUB7_MELAZ|nr:LysM receptor kinase [Melia azedarach]
MFNMGFPSFISVFTLFILCFCSLIHAQQPYVGLATTACENVDTSNSNSVLGYSCNGLNRSCQGYLTFRSQPPFNSVSSISTLLASDPSQLSEINSVSETATFETNKLVIVPVNCSCSGSGSRQYYQDQNTGDSRNLVIGARITVPLRCACPTKNQTDDGFRYLLSYLVAQGDTVNGISARFGVDSVKTLEANSLSRQDTINFFTTLLVPLENPPSSSQTIEPPPPPSSTPPPPPNSTSNEGSNKTWIYVVAGVLGGALILIVVIIIFCKFFATIVFFKFFYRRKKKKPDSIIVSHSFEERQKPFNKKSDEEYSQDFLVSISGVAQSLKVYSFKELQFATDNFSSSCFIKGFVYRGKINGDFAAIKKVNGEASKEISLLNKINHSNVIRLSGVCFNEGNWYLVYEYAVNGDLSDWIHGDKNEEKVLNWKQRIQIAFDVATGLSYLHTFTNPPHVHKDINSSNVLLDSDFRAKIANFALARPTEEEEGEFALTRHIVGTKGYMAPEYLENGLISTKLDVYAFGVLMLEMLTGKKAIALYAKENMHLSEVLNAVLNEEDGEENLRHFMDPCMQGDYPSELASLVIKIIDSCLKKDPTTRPTMYEIQHSLSNILNASRTW